MEEYKVNIGDIGYYDGIECECTDIIDDITIEVYGKFEKFFYPITKKHGNKLLALLGFTKFEILEVNMNGYENISIWNLEKNKE